MGAKEANRAPFSVAQPRKSKAAEGRGGKVALESVPPLAPRCGGGRCPLAKAKAKKAQHSTAQHGTVNKRVSESSAAGGAAVPLAVAPEQNQRFQCPLRSNSRHTHAPPPISPPSTNTIPTFNLFHRPPPPIPAPPLASVSPTSSYPSILLPPRLHPRKSLSIVIAVTIYLARLNNLRLAYSHLSPALGD